LVLEADQGHQGDKMKADIEKPVDYIRNVVDFRGNVFEGMASACPAGLWLEASVKDVRRIVVIAAASRSGSSLLFSILKRMPCVYSLSGESVPFYKINGLYSDLSLSDEIPKGALLRQDQRLDLSRDLLSDLSSAPEGNGIIKEENILSRYIDDLALRFSLQWPAAGFSYEAFTRLARQAYGTYIKAHDLFCVEEFYLELILSLRQEYKVINPYYYDIPVGMIRDKFPGLEIPSGPPHNTLVIEEPPFILLGPGKKPEKKDLLDKVLLLKSSADCYRMPFLEAVFPNADIRIIHLTRNPLGSVNGLYDGWLYRGFFSHNLGGILRKQGGMLNISGYSDRYQWGKWWWNYDLPPGWQSYVSKRLEEVCAFQWHSANNQVQEYLRKTEKGYCRVKCEDIIRGPASRAAQIDRIMDFAGIGSAAARNLDLGRLPVVQATEPPQPYRWKKRKDMLLSLLDDPKISGMSEGLGYCKNDIEEWL
jgi:hypothetical protein